MKAIVGIVRLKNVSALDNTGYWPDLINESQIILEAFMVQDYGLKILEWLFVLVS